MRILLLSDTDNTGGAGIAAYRLSEGLKNIGHDVVRIVSNKVKGVHEQNCYELFHGRKYQLLKYACEIIGRPSWVPYFRRRDLLLRLRFELERLRPDAISIHNLHSANWPLEFVSVALEYAPVYWTLHDMWSFTGEYYDYSDISNEQKPEDFKRNKETLSSVEKFWENLGNRTNSLSGVAPSSWLKSKARNSFWGNYLVEHIANPLPMNIYRNRGKEASRKVLDLPVDEKLLLLCSDNLNEFRKGGHLLISALEKLKSIKFSLVLMGGNTSVFQQRFGRRIRVYEMGYVVDENMKSIIYSSVDALLHPAPVDNLPNTIAEATACGCPTIAFSIGGVKEMVKDGVTGLLANTLNGDSFGEALQTFLLDKRFLSAEISSQCRLFAKNFYEMREQSEKYVHLFESYQKKLGKL